MKNWRCTIEVYPSVFFVRDWDAIDEAAARALHRQAYWLRFGRGDDPEIRTVEIER